VPLRARGGLLGSLSVAFAGPRSWRPADRDLLVAFAALTAQAMDRIRAREAEEEATAAARGLSETLQRSLLTDPPEPNVLQVAARYQPASQDAQVGGDWHDTFLTTDGGTTVVIGDVAGHDGTATAAMAQVRNVLRGVAQVVGEPPSAVLRALDGALARLRFPALTTAVLGQVVRDGGGGRALLWSNAGHPPPVLVTPDGEAELLWRPADLLLGVDPDATRTDHLVPLPPGTTLVLYTDGLVERRGEPLDTGLDRLVGLVGELSALPTDELCDQLLQRLGGDAEDDVALLVLRPSDG
jgi:serine phosphatase RsbU (regulator of sigma subunit)